MREYRLAARRPAIRRVEEIVWSYPRQPPESREVLLRVLERQPLTPDSALTWNLLRQAEASDVGPQALLAQDLFFLRRLDDRLRRAAGPEVPPTASPAPAPEDFDRAGLSALAPLVPALAQQVAEGGALAAASLKVLARVRTQDALDQVALAGEEELLRPYAMAALATYGGTAAAQVALEILDLELQRISPLVPALLPALRGVPTLETLGCLKALGPYPAMHAGVAAALEGFGALDYEPVLAPLLESQDVWVLLQTIETLVRLPRDRRGDALTRLYRRVDIPAVRLSCLQAIAEARAADDAPVAVEALGSPVPLVRAAAIEAVLALPIPRSEFHHRVMDLLDDPHPRVAMNAATACVSLDPALAMKRVPELLSSGSPTHVAQAVQCLVRISGKGVAAVLAAVLAKAPPGALRLQTVRALGRRAARDPVAAEVLVDVLAHADGEVRATAAWFLAGCCEDARGEAAASLAEAMARESDPAVRAVCAEALGLCGPIAAPLAPCLLGLLEDADGAARSAAWALATAFPETEASRALDRPAWARFALLRDWYAGTPDLDKLAGWIESADIDAALEALEVAGLVAGGGELLGSGHPRLARLEATLLDRLRESDDRSGTLDLLASQGRSREELAVALAAMAQLPEAESFADQASPLALPSGGVEVALDAGAGGLGGVPSYYDAGTTRPALDGTSEPSPEPGTSEEPDLGASRPGVSALDELLQLSENTSRAMLRRKVREALEDSVKPTVIPEAVRERAAEERRRRQKARRKARREERRTGVAPPSPEQLAADRARMKRVMGSGLAALAVLTAVGLGLGGGPSAAPPPRPRPSKRPGLDRPPLTKAPTATATKATPGAKPEATEPATRSVTLEPLRHQGDTTRESFESRWDLLRAWAEEQDAATQKEVFGIPQLARVRIRYRGDPDKACRLLDDLIEAGLKASR